LQYFGTLALPTAKFSLIFCFPEKFLISERYLKKINSYVLIKISKKRLRWLKEKRKRLLEEQRENLQRKEEDNFLKTFVFVFCLMVPRTFFKKVFNLDI